MRIWWKLWTFFPEKWKVHKRIPTPQESQRYTSYQMKGEKKGDGTLKLCNRKSNLQFSQFVKGNRSVYRFQTKGIGVGINLKPPQLQCIDSPSPVLSSPKLHMDTSCLSVLSSNVSSSERITFLTPYQKPSAGLHDHISLLFSQNYLLVFKNVSIFLFVSPIRM